MRGVVTVYRRDTVASPGSKLTLKDLGKYELVGVTREDETLVFVDGDTGAKIGIYSYNKEAAELVRQVYELMSNEKIKRFITFQDRIDSIFARTKLNLKRKQKHSNEGVAQYSYMTGWSGANSFKHLPEPKLTRATTDSSYSLVQTQLERLAEIAASYYSTELPELFQEQKEAMRKNKFIFGDKEIDTAFYAGVWSSMIFNINTSVDVHIDRRNIKSLNAIFCLRKDSVIGGGQLVLCDYRVGSPDGPVPVLRQETGDLILYPAYNSYHGVTKLHGTGRVTLVFYALNLAKKKTKN